MEAGKELLVYYQQRWQNKYKKPLIYNKYKEKWVAQDVVDSIGLDRAKRLVAYYFDIDRNGHPLQWFWYNFDKLDAALKQAEVDQEERKKLREQTKARVMNE